MKTVKVKNIEIGKGRPKICVSITGITKEEIISEGRKLKDLEVDIVEWRVDYFKDLDDINLIREALVELRSEIEDMPLIFTLRNLNEGGQRNIDLNYYKQVNKEILETKLIDIIDIEVNLYDEEIKSIMELARNKDIKVILSNHYFENTPLKDEMINILRKMENLGADICKLAVMPINKLDVLSLLEATVIINEKYANVPIITISMGAEGAISRMCGEIFGSCVTFASGGKQSAPGQVNIDELNTVMKIIEKNTKEKKSNKIFLIGFMGVGKTTISSCLSSLLKMKEVDIDNYIEETEKMSINEIFKVYGENYFRNCETEVLRKLKNEENIIISCGGGIVLKNENIEMMKKYGDVVLLEAEPKTIYERLKNCSNRPILNDNMNETYISELKEKRKDQYLKASDIIINTDNKNTQTICEEIVRKLK